MDILTYALAKSGSGSSSGSGNQSQEEKHLYQHHMIFNRDSRLGNISVFVVDANATPYSKYSDLYEVYAGKTLTAVGRSFDSAITSAYLVKGVELTSSAKISYKYFWQLYPSLAERSGSLTCNVNESFKLEDTVVEI